MLIAVCSAALIMQHYHINVSGMEAQTENVSGAEPQTDNVGRASASDCVKNQPEEDTEDGGETISVIVSVIDESESSPFDFIMDPQGLICRTDAARYGGKDFEEGATLYFKNTDGDYDYSHQSDWINVINNSAVPVNVTIEAAVKNLSEIELTEDSSFEGDDDETASIYLALVDDSGNEVPLSRDGSALIDIEIGESEDGDSFDSYSFGLTGACKTNGNWEEVEENPQVVITWTIESLSKRKPELDEIDLDQAAKDAVDLEGLQNEGTGASNGEFQPGETQPQGTQPDESKPGESQPGESQPDETQQGESQPDESQPGEIQPGESQPDETQPGESQPDEPQPDPPKPDGLQPGETSPDNSLSDESQPENSHPDNSPQESDGLTDSAVSESENNAQANASEKITDGGTRTDSYQQDSEADSSEKTGDGSNGVYR